MRSQRCLLARELAACIGDVFVHIDLPRFCFSAATAGLRGQGVSGVGAGSTAGEEGLCAGARLRSVGV